LGRVLFLRPISDRGLDAALKAHWGRMTVVCPKLRQRMHDAISAYRDEVAREVSERHQNGNGRRRDGA
jgi:hypothetical protein